MIVIVHTFHRVSPLLHLQHIRTRLKEATQTRSFVNLNQLSTHSLSSLDFPQTPIESAEPYESIIGQRSPLTRPQESGKHYESTVNPRSSLNYSRNFTKPVTTPTSHEFPTMVLHSSPHKVHKSTDTSKEITETIGKKRLQIIQLPFQNASSKAHSHVLPRAAFFDGRKRGKFRNATVILAHMKKAVIERSLVIGCKVDGHQIRSFKVQTMKLNSWIHANYPECTHDNVFVLCYDTPGRNNSRVSLVYANPDNESQHFETESEHPLFIPHTSIKRARSSVMVCVTVYDTPPLFSEWLHYQKTLGVDFVYINAQQSFLAGEEFNNTFFQRLLADGFVQLKVWQEYLNKKEVFYHSQLLYYQDCLYRFQGVHDYAMMVDTDDFVTPRTNTTLQHCLDNLFVEKVGSIRLRWVRYYEPKCGLNITGNLTIHNVGNLTQYMNISSASLSRNVKSVHKLSSTLEAKVHEVGELVPGYRWIIAPESVIYTAHLKKLKLSKDQLKKECGNKSSTSSSITKSQTST